MSVVWGLGLHAPVAQRVNGDAYSFRILVPRRALFCIGES
jgi:hypothetical protein